MFQLKPIVQGVLLACGGLGLAALSAPTQAQQTQQQQQQQTQQKLDRVTITGSNIRRTDTETVAPVEIITREQIERTGLPTVADVIRSIPSNTGGTFNEYANSFAPGAQSVSLRGLGQKATLVLLNGRRTAGYGFAQNIQDTFVDLSSIPSSAVERIEILKDGASAIYGSDAIAGVVNVILRRDFKGFDTSANAGFFEGKNYYSGSISAGFGDLGSDKFNVFGVIDYFKRDGLLMSETDFAPSRDLRRFTGGRNFQSLTAGGTWRQLTPTGGNTNNFRAIAECKDPVTFDEAVRRGLQVPAPLGAGFNQAGNTFCARDFSDIFSVVPETERIGFLGRATFSISNTMEAYAEANLSSNEFKFKFQEPFFAGTTGLYETTPGSRQLAIFPYNMRFAPGAGGNPFATGDASYNGVLNDFGTRDTIGKSDGARALAGLKYEIASWSLDSAVGYAQSKVSQDGKVLTKTGTSAAVGIPSDRSAFPGFPGVTAFPRTTGSTYNLNTPSANSQAVRDSMFVNDPTSAKSDMTFVDTRATTELGTLPGGAIGLALGIEYRKETMKVTPSFNSATGNILGRGATNVDGSRNSTAMFAELGLPLTQTLEAQLALRNDSYSDFGSALTPKVGLKWKASGDLLFRANWGRGFRAPSLPEITEAKAFFFTTITEPLTGFTSQIGGSIAANPGLKPETSRNAAFGVVFEPNPNFNTSIDFYEINWKNQVNFPDFQAIADNPADPRAFRSPITGEVLAIEAGYENSGMVKTRGMDIDIRYNARTTMGRFAPRLNLSYVDSYKLDGIELAGSNLAGAFINAISLPRVRGFAAMDYESGAWVISPRVNYIHSFRRVFFSNSPVNNGAVSPNNPAYVTYDLFGRYNVTTKFQVNASINNLTGETPPFDPGVSTTYFHDRTQYSIIGRTYRVGVRYFFN
jgi:iron complex outermembrane receptor protein